MTNRDFLATFTGAPLVALVTVVLLAAGAGPAEAVFTGRNGRIVYTGTRLLCESQLCWDDLHYDDDVCVVNPDGSGHTNLTNSPDNTDRHLPGRPTGRGSLSSGTETST